jgi:ribosome-binding factor A
METTRQKKISRLLQKEMSEIFQRDLKELTLSSLVTVTIARVSPDLSIVKYYLSIFPTQKSKEVIDCINENKSRIRYALGQRVGKQLRIIPEPSFFVDDSLDYLENIDKLLKE